jgi:hypothetical protein
VRSEYLWQVNIKEVFSIRERRNAMGSSRQIKVDTGMGIIWFIGWLFTIAFAKLVWWQAILGLAVWPYYLGVAVR